MDISFHFFPVPSYQKRRADRRPSRRHCRRQPSALLTMTSIAIALGRRIQIALEDVSRAADSNEHVLSTFFSEFSEALKSVHVDRIQVSLITERLRGAFTSADNSGYRTHVYQAVFDELCILVGQGIPNHIYPTEGEINVVMIDGHLVGSGLTTVCLKYASYYKDKRGYAPAIVFTGDAKIDVLASRKLKKAAKEKNITCFVRETSHSLENVYQKVQNFKRNNHKLIIIGTSMEREQVYEKMNPNLVMLVVNKNIDVIRCIVLTSFQQPIPAHGVIVMDMDLYPQGVGAISTFVKKKWPVAFIGSGKENKDFEIFDAGLFVSRHLGIQVPSNDKEDIAQETSMDKLKISSEQEKEASPNSSIQITSPTANSPSLPQVANTDVSSSSGQQISLQNEDTIGDGVKDDGDKEVTYVAVISYKCKGGWGNGSYSEDSSLGSRDVDALWVCGPQDSLFGENTRQFSRTISHKNFLTFRHDHSLENSLRMVCERVEKTLVNYIEEKKDGDELIMEYTLKAKNCVPRKSSYVPPKYREILKDMTDFVFYVGEMGQCVDYIGLDALAIRDGTVKFHDLSFTKLFSPVSSPTPNLEIKPVVNAKKRNARSLFKAIKALFDHFGFKETQYPYDLKDFLSRLKNYSDKFLPNHLALMSPSERIGFISRIWNERFKLRSDGYSDRVSRFKYNMDDITNKLSRGDWTLQFCENKSAQLGPVNDCFDPKGSYMNNGEGFLNFCRVLCQHLNENIYKHGFDSSTLDVDLTLMEVFAEELISVHESLHEQHVLENFLT